MLVLEWLIAGELGLGLVALVWAYQSESELPHVLDVDAFLIALVLTFALTVLNFGLFRAARRWAFVKHSFAFFDDEIFPLVRKAAGLEIVVVAAAAGFSEELLFRGLLMPRMGLVASSVLFGVLHGPHEKLWPLALWATFAGLGFGVVYRETGNLAIPVLVHALYDGLALFYIRSTKTI